jgi:hypothetical protein
MRRRGTCVLHAHLTGAQARRLPVPGPANGQERKDDDDDDGPPDTTPKGAVVALLLVGAVGIGGIWWLGSDAPIPGLRDGPTATATDAGAPATAADGPAGAAGGSSPGVDGTGPPGGMRRGLTPAEATARVDELLGGGAAGRLKAASEKTPATPVALASRTNDDEVSAEVEALIAQSGHPVAPDLGEYEAVLDGADDGAPGPAARGWAAMGHLEDDRARQVAEQKLDALAQAHPDDIDVAVARAEVHVDDDPDAALAAAARARNPVDAARLRGQAFAQKGDVDSAVAALSATADSDPRATRALLSLQAPRGRCADVEAASARLASERGGQAVVDHVRLLASCRPALDDATALVDATVALPGTSEAERAALHAALAEAGLTRGATDVVERSCDRLGGVSPSPDVARARARCALARGEAPPPTASTSTPSTQGTSTATTLLSAYGVRDARTAPWGRAAAQLRFVGALHDGRPTGEALADVVEALWSPVTAAGRVPPLGPREADSLVRQWVPEARRPLALALALALAGDIDGGLAALGDAGDADTALVRAALRLGGGRAEEAKKALPKAGPATTGIVARAVTALQPSSTPAALRSLLADARVGPRAYRALVERGASTAADAAVARRFALHPDVIAADGAR